MTRTLKILSRLKKKKNYRPHFPMAINICNMFYLKIPNHYKFQLSVTEAATPVTGKIQKRINKPHLAKLVKMHNRSNQNIPHSEFLLWTDAQMGEQGQYYIPSQFGSGQGTTSLILIQKTLLDKYKDKQTLRKNSFTNSKVYMFYSCHKVMICHKIMIRQIHLSCQISEI